MAGFNTVAVALFIRGDNTALQTSAKNWLMKHVGGSFSRKFEFILVADPDTQPPRWIGVAFNTDPGTAAQVKKLVDAEPDAHTRMTLQNMRALKQMVNDEMTEKGWRIKP